MLRDVIGAVSIVLLSGFFISAEAQTEQRLSICRPANRTALANQQADALQKALQCVADVRHNELELAKEELRGEASAFCESQTFSVPFMLTISEGRGWVGGPPIQVKGRPRPIPPGPDVGIPPTFGPNSPYSFIDGATYSNEIKWQVIQMIQEEWLKAYSDCVDKWLADHQDQLFDRAVQIAKPRLSLCTKAFDSASSDPATCFRAAFCAARHV